LYAVESILNFKSMPLKAYFFILFMGLSLLSVAQPRHIRLVDALSAENFAKHFNTDTVQLSRINTSETPAGVFVAYRKADTLNFNHKFYKSFDGPGYTKVGLVMGPILAGSLISIFLLTSSTHVPISDCLVAKVSCPSVNFDFFIRFPPI